MKAGAAIAMILALLLAAYVGAYLWTVTPVCFGINRGGHASVALYRFETARAIELAAVVFAPLEWLD